MYQVNSPRVVHETIEDETVIIDTVTGTYFTATGNAARLWQALAGGAEPARLAEAWLQQGLAEHDLKSFVESLLHAELVVPRSDDGQAVVLPPLSKEQLPPALVRHDDLQGLIELDPIHEIDTAQGWPFRSPEEP
jgi:hypothetical protein